MAAPLVHIDPRPSPTTAPAARKPAWLKVKAPGGATYLSVQRMMRDLREIKRRLGIGGGEQDEA